MFLKISKHDISDIVEILREQQRIGEPLTLEQIDKAVTDTYDGWGNMPDTAQVLIQSILSSEDMDALYEAYASEEAARR